MTSFHNLASRMWAISTERISVNSVTLLGFFFLSEVILQFPLFTQCSIFRFYFTYKKHNYSRNCSKLKRVSISPTNTFAQGEVLLRLFCKNPHTSSSVYSVSQHFYFSSLITSAGSKKHIWKPSDTFLSHKSQSLE